MKMANIIASRSQMVPNAGSIGEYIFFTFFSVGTIKDLVERRGLNHGVKAVRP